MRLDHDVWARRLADRMERERDRRAAGGCRRAAERQLPLSLIGWGAGAVLAAAVLSPILSAVVSYVAR